MRNKSNESKHQNMNVQRRPRLLSSSLRLCLVVCLQVFGFLNFVLWAGNIWFVFKETSWHKGASRLAGGAAEKQGGTFSQQPYNQGSFDTQGTFGQPSDYSQVGGPTSYSNQM